MTAEDESLVAFVTTTIYDIILTEGSMKPLCGYDDRNYLITDRFNEDRKYVLKIANEFNSSQDFADILDEIIDSSSAYIERIPNLHFTTVKLIKTTSNKLSTNLSLRLIGSGDGEAETRTCNVKLFEYFPGRHLNELIEKLPVDGQAEELFSKLGRLCNQLFCYLVTQRHLMSKLSDVRGDSFSWQVMNGDRTIERLANRFYSSKQEPRRILIDKVLSEFWSIKDYLNALPQYILHSDLNVNNILVSETDLVEPKFDSMKLCVLDFGDLQVGPEIVELAVLTLYNVLKQDLMSFDEAIRRIAKWTIQGYTSSAGKPIERKQMLAIPVIMRLRMCQSLLNGLEANARDPGNEYAFRTNKTGWQLLELLVNHAEFSDNERLVELWTTERRC